MKGKRYTTQKFGGIEAILGALVFVTTKDGELVPGTVQFITDDSAAEGYRDRVHIAYTTLGGWDDPPVTRVEALPFYEATTRAEADKMPPGMWTWPRTWQEER